MTLKGLKNIIVEFFNKHKQVNHVSFGDLHDYIAIPDKKYTSVNIEFGGSSISGKFINHNFNISISDLMSLEYTDTEHDTISDALEVAKDFLAYINEFNYIFPSNSSIQPFRENTGDITAGIVISLYIQVPLGLNECAIPFEYESTTTTSTTIEPTTTSTTSSTSTSTTLEPSSTTSTSTSTTSTTLAPTTSTSTTSTSTSTTTTSTTLAPTTSTTSSTSSTTSTTTLAPTTSTSTSTTSTSTTIAPTTTTTSSSTTTTTTPAPTTSTTTSTSTLAPTTSTTTTTSTTAAPTTTTTTTAPPAVAQFNFNPTAQNIAGWTDVSGQPHTAVLTATHTATGIGVSSIATNKWLALGGTSANTFGKTTGNNSGVYPDSVLNTFWFTYSSTYPIQGDNLEINGLAPGSQYTIEFFASRAATGGSGISQADRLMDVRCTDANGTTTTTTYNVKDNTSTLLTFNNQLADSNGKIFLATHARTDGNGTNGYQYGYINALRIIKV